MEINLNTLLLLLLSIAFVSWQTAKRFANSDHRTPSRASDRQKLLAGERPLADDLYNSLSRAEFHDRRPRYIPIDAIRRYVIYSAVLRELRRADPTLEEEFQSSAKNTYAHLTEWICEKAQKLFAIVILCDLDPDDVAKAMRSFKEHGYGDSKLPLPDTTTISPLPSVSPGFSQSIWNPQRLFRFHEQQWKVHVPVFSPDEYDYDLSTDTIFPFTLQHAIPKEGAFSSVYRVTIHKAHNKWPKIEEVALKELKVSNTPQDDEQRAIDQAWNNEARALNVIRKLSHGHIVKCIAAIRRGDSRYFMFPWADGDNLRDFWNDPVNHKPPNAEIVRQAIVQLRGIADALDRLHNFSGGHSGDDNESNTVHSISVPIRRSSTFDVDDDGASQITLNNEVDDYRHAERAHSIRHGDLKPENILRFKDEASALGILKIADMGLAKRHVVATQLRSQGTTTHYSTRRYEAPETVANEGTARSRLYDLWSMGCIIFEFVVWILYGNAELQSLYSQLEANAQQTCQYYEILVPTNEDPGGPRVHHVVSQWMQFMQKKDPECTSQPSALSDLLKIVREMLLVVPLPPDRQSNVERGRQFPMGTVCRATARELRNELDIILSKIDNSQSYAFRGGDRANIKPPSPSSTLLGLPSAKHAGNSSFPSTAHGMSSQLLSVKGLAIRQGSSDYTMPPHQGWIFEIDNAFAEQVQQIVGQESLKPKHRDISTLCTTCASFNFWKGGFEIDEKVSNLFDRASSCELCKMLYDIYVGSTDSKGDSALFSRNESTIMLAGDKFPVLSILRSAALNTLIPVQLGFPELPEAGSDVFFSIIRAWLNDCDAKHADCKGKEHSLPARLIHVGTRNAPVLRLIDVVQERVTNVQYTALSHRWGKEKTCPPFRTLVENEDRFRQGIPEQDLPKTFADAVRVTRELNMQYLWIDSLCIRQGVGGDFEVQSKTMENVFSGAYCVLAASRASNQRDGFLGERPRREYVTISEDHDKVFYICRNIDNFGKDVIEGQLNRRGWVLQERVLARRTIYFTENQTYFECGSGVRCETMTKLQNDMAQYLGDPNFPRKVQQANRGGKIMVFKDLFRQYSRLDLTRDADRPFAIAGLEKRLHGALQTSGGYGIFDDGDHEDGGLFHRSLLWQKGEEMASDEFLERISFDKSIKIPTWSWMAYKGGIDYIDLPGKSAIWEIKGLTPPWTGGGLKHIDTGSSQGVITISAVVRNFAVAGRGHNEVELKYDTGRTSASDGQAASCVIVAKAREGLSDRERRHYVLLVTPTHQVTGRGDKIFERVGAGYMLGKFIALDKPGVEAKIV